MGITLLGPKKSKETKVTLFHSKDCTDVDYEVGIVKIEHEVAGAMNYTSAMILHLADGRVLRIKGDNSLLWG